MGFFSAIDWPVEISTIPLTLLSEILNFFRLIKHQKKQTKLQKSLKNQLFLSQSKD